jgi:hypothetical protein
MVELAKFLHFWALAIGIGGGMANMLAAPIARAAEPEAKPVLGKLQRRIGQMGAGAILVLWVTGIWLVVVEYPVLGRLPMLFWVKIAAVLVLTYVSARGQLLSLRAMRGGPPPDPAVMKKIAMAGATSALAALALAVAAFN